MLHREVRLCIHADNQEIHSILYMVSFIQVLTSQYHILYYISVSMLSLAGIVYIIKSSHKSMTYGAPQGSILDSLLFFSI